MIDTELRKKILDLVWKSEDSAISWVTDGEDSGFDNYYKIRHHYTDKIMQLIKAERKLLKDKEK